MLCLSSEPATRCSIKKGVPIKKPTKFNRKTPVKESLF